MFRLALVAAAVLAGCNTSENDRPATLEYVTEAILQPSCSQATCHSSYRMEEGYAFDTVDTSRKSLRSIVVPGDAQSSLLYIVLTRTKERMPLDAPLFDKDIALIKLWIDDGAEGLEQ